MKKALALAISLSIISAGAVAHANDNPFKLQQSEEYIYTESFDFEAAHLEKGGKPVFEGIVKLDTLNRFNTVAIPNKKIDGNFASTHSDELRISKVILDMEDTWEFHESLNQMNMRTKSYQQGPVYSWVFKKFDYSPELLDNLVEWNIKTPITAIVMAEKKRGPVTPFMKGLKTLSFGLVSFGAIDSLASNSDWKDYTSLQALAQLASAAEFSRMASTVGGVSGGYNTKVVLEYDVMYGGYKQLGYQF